MRVAFDLSFPLKTGSDLKRPGGSPTWILFKYERLNSCGIISYDKEYCRKSLLAPDLSSPLKTGFDLKRSGGSPTWIPFKYERLNGLCFSCGIIGYDKEHCRKSLPANRA